MKNQKNKNKRFFWVCIFLLCALKTNILFAAATTLGFREFSFGHYQRTHNNQLKILTVAIWYPTEQKNTEKNSHAIWKIKDVVRNAPLPDKPLPLILFSHGYSGSEFTNCWFAENLVPHGFIVAHIRHYGNNLGNMIPELCARPWLRPEDMSFALDQLLKTPPIKQSIDINRIGAAGFSQGGMACLWLAGAQANLTKENIKQQITVINDPNQQEIHFKKYDPKELNVLLDNFTEEDYKQANKSYYDSRIKAVFAIAPSLDDHNYIFTHKGLLSVRIPVFIVVGSADEAIDKSLFFFNNIKSCSIKVIPNAHHLTMLNEGTESGKQNYPIYTTDPEGIDRNSIHQAIALEAKGFFNNKL